jgi:hypothetical protein
MMITKVCKICGNNIPSRIDIDGKRHSISKRTKCLKCSPFKKPKNEVSLMAGYDKKQKNMALVTAYRQEMKRKSIEYKGGKCENCGYDRCAAALTFHHRDPSMKSFNMNDGRTRRWEILVTELDKCALLCHNCHMEHHAGFISV